MNCDRSQKSGNVKPGTQFQHLRFAARLLRYANPRPGCEGPRGPCAARLCGAEERRSCASREARSSSFSSRLSERSARRARSELRDAGARASTAGQSARSAPDRRTEAPRMGPTGLRSPCTTALSAPKASAGPPGIEPIEPGWPSCKLDAAFISRSRCRVVFDHMPQIVHHFLQRCNGAADTGRRLQGGAQVGLGVVQRGMVDVDAVARELGRQAGLA